ncbi:GTPase IMAP family member 9-like isoform X1 [Littorina saxatilis]|uniref:AIG1-type G domain-containing protein n=1 Tax=Littorina saxatilis TaxID=31220 RepID=A0AAN9GDW3_9CAEN
MSTKGESKDHRILVIGKAGNGKSSVCNTIAGCKHFKTSKGFFATTEAVHSKCINKYGRRILVVDTPDVTSLDMTPEQRQAEVNRWREETHPYPTAVLLTIRCDVRYTAEEHAIYRQIQRLWGDNSLQSRLVVAFTFGDCQDKPIAEELKTVCPELISVLRVAGQRYFMFNNKDKHSDEQGEQLINFLEDNLTEPEPLWLTYLPHALTGAALFAGIDFAARYDASNSAEDSVSAVMFFFAGLALIAWKVWDVFKG